MKLVFQVVHKAVQAMLLAVLLRWAHVVVSAGAPEASN